MRLDAPLRGPRLIIEGHRPGAEHGPYCGWMNDPEVLRGLEAPVREYRPDDLAAFIAAMAASPRDLLLGMYTGDGSHVGNIKLTITAEHRRGSIGLIVDPRHWGKGYATEAISLVTDHAFEVLRLIKVTAGCYGSNPGSERSFLKAGFTVEARRPMHHLDRGRWVECVLLGRIHPRPDTVPREPWS
ncbi:MAG: GNAT family protein [Pseudomonadota bacterium]